ncbi:MAG: response regulator [Spirochaetaceae bacterium]|nr:response regulator [Spirochaetaceae bacterium]
MHKTKKFNLLTKLFLCLFILSMVMSSILYISIRQNMTGTLRFVLPTVLISSIVFFILLFLFSSTLLKMRLKTIKRLNDALQESLKDKADLEEQNKDLVIQLRHTQTLETIGTLAGGMAHDFNNLLSPILGYSDLVLSQLSDDNTLYLYVNEIVRAASKAKEQVEQVLLFSRQIDKDKKESDLESTIKETISILRPLIPSTVEIKLELGKEKTYVTTESSAVHQIIFNLCTNGWQAMEEKVGVLTIKLEKSEESDNFVLMSVTDTGRGIDSNTIEHIFEPFFSTGTDRSSSGLGLSVVEGILNSVNGKITVESTPGHGSVFTVYFPLKQMKSKEQNMSSLDSGSGHILIVDDDENITALICNMLADFGFHIELFNNSHDALKAFREQPYKFNLVITDLTMPKLTGSSLRNEMKKIREDIPILIMTGYGENSSDNDYYILKKPFLKNELLGAIKRLMEKKT